MQDLTLWEAWKGLEKQSPPPLCPQRTRYKVKKPKYLTENLGFQQLSHVIFVDILY
jgi:hypothetical protein